MYRAHDYLIVATVYFAAMGCLELSGVYEVDWAIKIKKLISYGGR